MPAIVASRTRGITAEVTNDGDETAEAVQVHAELNVDGEVVAEGEQIVDFLSGGETEEVVFVFSDVPAGADIELRVASFKGTKHFQVVLRRALVRVSDRRAVRSASVPEPDQALVGSAASEWPSRSPWVVGTRREAASTPAKQRDGGEMALPARLYTSQTPMALGRHDGGESC